MQRSAETGIHWRPIRTAPRDGTLILIYEPHPGGTENAPLVMQARWVDVPHSRDPSDEGGCPGWYAAYIAL